MCLSDLLPRFLVAHVVGCCMTQVEANGVERPRDLWLNV
jgi:hypothetical protein